MKTTDVEEKKILSSPNLKFLREHLTLIVLIPSLVGGIWQIIELTIISPAYVRFFSITQSITDGLLLLLLFGSLFIVHQIWKHSDYLNQLLGRLFHTKHHDDLLVIRVLILLTISALLLSPFFLAFSWTIETWHIVYISVGIVLWLLLYITKNLGETDEKKGFFHAMKTTLSGNLRFTIRLFWLSYLIPLIWIVVNLFHLSFTFSDTNVNFFGLQYKVKQQTGATEAKINYFNDQYIFWNIIIEGKSYTYVSSMETYVPADTSIREAFGTLNKQTPDTIHFPGSAVKFIVIDENKPNDWH